MNLFGGIKLLEHALDVRATRQQVINSNIANEETPGYRAQASRCGNSGQHHGDLL